MSGHGTSVKRTLKLAQKCKWEWRRLRSKPNYPYPRAEEGRLRHKSKCQFNAFPSWMNTPLVARITSSGLYTQEPRPTHVKDSRTRGPETDVWVPKLRWARCHPVKAGVVSYKLLLNGSFSCSLRIRNVWHLYETAGDDACLYRKCQSIYQNGADPTNLKIQWPRASWFEQDGEPLTRMKWIVKPANPTTACCWNSSLSMTLAWQRRKQRLYLIWRALPRNTRSKMVKGFELILALVNWLWSCERTPLSVPFKGRKPCKECITVARKGVFDTRTSHEEVLWGHYQRYGSPSVQIYNLDAWFGLLKKNQKKLLRRCGMDKLFNSNQIPKIPFDQEVEQLLCWSCFWPLKSRPINEPL